MQNEPTNPWPAPGEQPAGRPSDQPLDVVTGGPTPARRRKLAGAGLVAAGLVGGAVLASSLGASADTTSSTSTASPGSSSSSAPARPSIGGATPVRSDEKEVTGANAATLKAAALKAVPGGKVVRVESDAGDAAYEVHMTKADGTPVTVKFDKNLKELRVEAGMGKGDPGGHGGHGGPGGPGGGHGDGDGDGPGQPGGAPTGAPSGAPTTGA